MTDVPLCPSRFALEHDALDDDAVLVRRREPRMRWACSRGRRPRRDAAPGAAADGHGATRGDEPRSAAERERATTRGAAVARRAVGRRGPRRRGRRGPAMVARANAAHPPRSLDSRDGWIRATCAEFARGRCR